MWVFASPLVQVVGDLLHLLGFPFIAAVNATLLLLVAIGGAAMFAIGRRLGGNTGAAVAAAAFFFAPYLLIDIYARFAASEMAAASMIPVAILALMRIDAGQERGSVLMLALAVAAIGLAHHVVFLMSFPFLIGAAFLLFRHGKAKGAIALAGCASGLAIAAWSWLPAIAEAKWVRLDALTRGFFVYSDHFVAPIQIVWSPWRYDKLSFTLGPLLMLTAIAGIVAAGTWRKLAIVLAVAAAAGILMATAASAPIWRHLAFLHPIAFPWRFLVLPSIALPPLCALAAARWPVPAAALVAVHGLLFAVHAHPERLLPESEAAFSPMRIAAGILVETSADEYRPRTVPALQDFSSSAFDPPLAGRVVAFTPVDRVYDVAIPAAMMVRLEIYQFPGWSVRIDGREVETHPSSTGLIEFRAPAGVHRIEAVFVPTADRALADVIALAGLAGAIVAHGLVRRRVRQ